MRKLPKILNISYTLIFAFIITCNAAFADTSTIANSFDTNIVRNKFDTYYKPVKLIIAPIDFQYDQSQSLAKSVFFYFTDRLNFPESPIQYVIDQSGTLSKLVDVDEDFTTDIVIGVDSKVNALTDQQLDLIFQNIIDKYDIPKENIELKNIKLSSDKKSLTYSDSTNTNQLQLAIDNLKSRNTTPNILKVDVINVAYSPNVDPGKSVDVELDFKNNSGFNIYQSDQNKIVVGTADGKNSIFFINNNWLSPSKVGSLSQNRVAKGDIGTIKFQILSPVSPGITAEDFNIYNGNAKASDNFTIKINVNDIGQKIIQMTDPGFGYVNVRESPSASSQILGSVLPGEKYIYTDKQNNYYKIKVPAKNIEGWVAAGYAKQL